MMSESIVVDLRPEFDLTGDSDDDDSTSDNKIANVKVGDYNVREAIGITGDAAAADDDDDDDDDDVDGDKVVYLAVPFDEIDNVKAIRGAWYDKDAKKWCTLKRNLDKKREAFKRWIVDDALYPNNVLLDIPAGERTGPKCVGVIHTYYSNEGKSSSLWICPKGINPDLFEMFHVEYLNVPFNEVVEVKAQGAKFDWEKKRWYILKSKIESNPNFFQRWRLSPHLRTRTRDEIPSRDATPESARKKGRY